MRLYQGVYLGYLEIQPASWTEVTHTEHQKTSRNRSRLTGPAYCKAATYRDRQPDDKKMPASKSIIALASDLLSAGTNPFLIKLPKINQGFSSPSDNNDDDTVAEANLS